MPRVSRTDWQLEQPAMLRLLDGDDRRQARETDGSSVLIDDDATSVWRRDLYQAAEWLTLWGSDTRTPLGRPGMLEAIHTAHLRYIQFRKRL